MNEIIQRIEQLVKNHGNSKAKFARLIGIKDSLIRYWFVSKTDRIQADNLIKICQSLNVSANWLLLGIGPMYLTEEAKVQPAVKKSGEIEDELGDLVYSRGSESLSPEFVAAAKREMAKLISNKEASKQ